MTGLVYFHTEDDMYSYLEEYMNANGKIPQVAGVDDDRTPFLAWLNESGGDSTFLRVLRLVDQGEWSRPEEETPSQGTVSSLVYPVVIVGD